MIESPVAALPISATAAYEERRASVLAGQPQAEGMAALRYHGMLHGLALLLRSQTALPSVAPLSPPPSLPRDSTFIRLVANLVLYTYPELTHVC